MTMPAGTYWVGDLCYVMRDRWSEFCDITISDHECLSGEFILSNGTRFASYRTAWGDGSYTDTYYNSYGVDAGLIGCILVSDISKEQLENLDLGHVHVFDKPFETGYLDPREQRPGKIFFNNLMVDTKPDYYDEDEDEYTYDSEDA